MKSWIYIVMCYWSCQAFGKRLPRVITIPPVVTAVHEDASISLSVVAKGVRSYEWIHQQKKICKESSCQIDTKPWTRGRHPILVNLKNRFGGIQFVFYIDVVERPFGAKIEPIEIKPVPTQKNRLREFLKSGSTARVREGRGFVTLGDKVTLLESTGQSIQWEGERLHASGGGVFHIKAEKEEHFTFPGSIVFLKSHEDTRYIQTQRGWVRSRFFSPSPNVQVLAGWLSVLPGDFSDVLVGLSPNGDVQIAVLRGMVRAHWYDDQGVERDKVVSYHHHAVFSPKDGVAPIVKKFSDPRLENLVIKSTPGVQTVEPDEDDYVFVRAAKNKKRALDRYKKSPADSMANLQLLMPFVRDDEANDDMLLATARASKHLGLYQQSLALLEELDDEVVAGYWSAQMFLSRSQFQKAVDFFDIGQGFEKEPEVHAYYYGVASYHTQDTRSAKVSFQKSLWARSEGPVADSCRKFLHAIHEDSSFDLQTHGFLIRNSQVLGLTESTPAPQGILSRESLGFDYGGQVAVPYVRSWRGYLEFLGGVNGVVYFDADLQKASPFQAFFTLQSELKAGGLKKGENLFSLKASPTARTVSIGQARTVDQLQTDWEIQFLRLWSRPGWRFQKIQTIDPDPTFDDALDVILNESVPASDRSAVSSSHQWFMTPYQNRDVQTEVYLKIQEARYSNSTVQDSFKDVGVGLKIRWELEPRWNIKFSLDQVQRKFFARERADAKLSVDFNLEFRFHPSWYFQLGFFQLSQTSNLETYTFDKQIVRSGFMIQY